MKSILVLAIALASPSAFACFDPNAVPFSYKGLEYYSEHVKGFRACMKRIEKVGVDLREANAKISVRVAGRENPYLYSVVVQGRGEGGVYRISARYNLETDKIECSQPTTNIPRCM